jgi:hypothetical protein
VFQLERTTFIYWPIECTLKASFCQSVLTWNNYLHLLAN